MKHIYSAFGAIAVAAMFASCSIDNEVLTEPSPEKVVVTFTSEKPGVETKTAITEGAEKASYVWTSEDEDNIHVYQVTTTTNENDEEVEVETELERTVSISTDNKIVTITAEATEADSYLFRAKVFGDATSGGNPRIKAAQTPSATSFDPNTDILVSNDLATETLEDLKFDFYRKVSVNKMTLKNIVSGEKVKEVKIGSDKELTGYYNGTSISGQSKQITLSYSDAELNSEGQFDVYFVAMENAGQTLTVTVTTDAHVYTKTFTKTIDFTLGTVTRFGVALPAGEEIKNYSGEWVIGGTSDDHQIAATAYESGMYILLLL